MPIIGLNYNKIIAEKKGSTNKQIKINTGPDIKDIRKSKLQGFDASDIDLLSIDFEFKSEIEPDVGLIDIEGTIIYKTEKSDEILKAWKKDKMMTPEAQVEVINHIFKKTGILALQLSDALQFPPVISMPKIEIHEKEETKSKK